MGPLPTFLVRTVMGGKPGGWARPRARRGGGGSPPPVVMVLLIGGLSLFTNLLLYPIHVFTGTTSIGERDRVWQDHTWQENDWILNHSEPLLLALLAAALVALSWIMARCVNINTFSLHGMYRDRFVRDYLGASNAGRKADRFTGFSNTDDIAMAALDPRLRPFHVVNLTLNLVAGNRLAWQQRKAMSFTVTPLSCGSSEVGYRASSEYGGGMSLGTAVAIPGAAASPKMGYHSSPVVGFIMTLFNARPGGGLGNPAAPAD